jgi:parallel beta-helix repeat protein
MKTLLFSLLLLATVASHARCGEVLRYTGEETLYRDTVWSEEVLIDGILTVAPGVTLEIRPGTVVRFSRMDSNGDGIGEHELFIQGTFRALGTAAAPVLFTSAEERPFAGDWGAINMMASEGENRLEHCVVEYAYRGFHAHFAKAELTSSVFRHNVRGIQFQEATVGIEACRIVGNRNGLQFRDSTVTLSRSVVSENYWGLRCVYSDVRLAQCRIEGNLVNGANLRDSTFEISASRIAANRKGLYLQRSRGAVRDNALVDNSEHGILLEDSDCEVRGNLVAGNGRSGVKWVDSLGILRGNLLIDNGEYALVNDGSGAVDARENWWGAVSPEEIGVFVRDGGDRPGSGFVAVSPPLTARPLLPAPLPSE